jgi:hypothetical protein
MKKTMVSSLFLAGIATVPCAARSWTSVVDPTVFLDVDTGNLENALERDPFHFDGSPTKKPSVLRNSISFTSGPTIASVPTPTISPTAAQPHSPTMSPTARYDLIVGNGGCAAGSHLYEVKMEDSWGDGWDGSEILIVEKPNKPSNYTGFQATTNQDAQTTTISEDVVVNTFENRTVEVYKGSLEKGFEGYGYTCLKTTKCYLVSVGGGTWENEIQWEVRKVTLGTPREERSNTYLAASGSGTSNCEFSVPDSSGSLKCLLSCEGPGNADGRTSAQGQGSMELKSITPTTDPGSLAPSIDSLSSQPSAALSGTPSMVSTSEPTPSPESKYMECIEQGYGCGDERYWREKVYVCRNGVTTCEGMGLLNHNDVCGGCHKLGPKGTDEPTPAPKGKP